MSDPLPERIGKYPVTGALGRGATSRVYLGEDSFSGRPLAIKVMVRDRMTLAAADGPDAPYYL